MQDVVSKIPGPVDPARHRVLAGVSRVQVLEVLRAQTAPLAVVVVADRVGLHPNTVRLHLDQLVEAGLVAREPEPRDRPGRPRLVYVACLLYTSDAADDLLCVDIGGRRI